MNDFSSSGAAAAIRWTALRAEIDAVDAGLLDLVAKRLRLADQLVALKSDQPGLPIRPGREIELLRN